MKNKYDKTITAVIYPIILLVFPLLQIWRGVEFSDSTCSLANYTNVTHLDSFWRYGYYLSNEIGRFMTRLPFGHTLIGMNLYTGLVISILALVSYFFMRKYFSPTAAFLGILLAEGLCWCPSLILYNYLTYLFFDAAVILLWLAMTREKRQSMHFILAGVCLALNLFVRFPNIMEVVLIVVVWIHAYMTRKTDSHGVRNTLYCIAGYAAGSVFGFLLIILTGKLTDFWDMIGRVLFLSDNASGYSFADMLRAIVKGYLNPYKFELFMLAAIAAGMIAFHFIQRKATTRVLRICQCLYAAAAVVMYVWFYHRGLFVFNYSDYFSMIRLAAIFLTLSWGCILYTVAARRVPIEQKLFALLLAVVMLITPIGSNNGIYPLVNNLFLVAPFTLYVLHQLGKEILGYSGRMILGSFLVLLFVQSILFGVLFRYRDGNSGEPMNTRVEGIAALQGMWTTQTNAESLEALAAYTDGLPEGQSAILYGHIPGLYYLLDLEPATTALWIDLDTNPADDLQQDLDKIQTAAHGQDEMPLLITTAGRDVNLRTNEKEIMLAQFLEDNGYREDYRSERYIVYRCME